MFDKAFEYILNWEGGYSNDPNDPGGETKYGISKRAFPDEDIKNLTKERAKEIYEEKYWKAAFCDKLSFGLALMKFDCAVNQGVGAANSLFKDASLFSTDEEKKIKEFAVLRLLRYAANKNFNIYGKGWTRRVVDILGKALKG